MPRPPSQRGRRPGAFSGRHPTGARRLLALCLVLASALSALAQTPPERPSQPASKRLTRIAAYDDTLWIARSAGVGPELFARKRSEKFDLGRELTQSIAHLAPNRFGTLAFFSDGAVYQFGTSLSDARPALRLPGDAIPIATTTGPTQLYALVPGAAAVQVEPRLEGASAAAGRLWVVAFDGDDWLRVAECPPGPTAARDIPTPQILIDGGQLRLFWLDADDGQIRQRVRKIAVDESAVEPAKWTVGATLDCGAIEAFWPLALDHVPTIVVARRGDDGGESLSAYQVLGAAPDARPEDRPWRPRELRLSATADGAQIERYTHAAVENQHVVVLGLTSARRPYLRFGRIGGDDPLEATVDLDEIFARPTLVRRGYELQQATTFLILIFLLIGLFVFRRDSMVRPVEMIPGRELAFHVQRLAAWMIDFAPFAIAASVMLQVDMQDALGALVRWGLYPDPENPELEAGYLMWWGLSVFGCTLYMLVLELALGRTIGKLLVGIRLQSEDSQPPRFWQLATRNLMRLIELMPQFWLAFVLVLLFSRNRQRLGDIFAQTVVYRHARLVIHLPNANDVGASPETDADTEATGADARDDEDDGSNDAADRPDDRDVAAEDDRERRED